MFYTNTRSPVNSILLASRHSDWDWTRVVIDHVHVGAPGVREQYSSDEGGRYYAAFLLDPDGNNVEAVHRGRSVIGVPRGGTWPIVQFDAQPGRLVARKHSVT